jgi:hypothetical protein
MTVAFAVPLLHAAKFAGDDATGWLRPLTGADEALLSEMREASAALRTTQLLAAVTTRIGAASPVTPEILRDLTIGDRERLLLGCVIANFGAELEVVARCPEPDCGQLAELSVSLVEAAANASPQPDEHQLEIDAEDGPHRVIFRLPTGRDQEAAARQALVDPGAAAADLLARCVIQAGAPVSINSEAAIALEQAIEALDPGIETIAEAPCPACGRPVRTLLDAFALLTSGLASSDRLYAEVDRLARTYHWSEAEILAMPLARRRRYLELIMAGDAA